MPRPAVPERLFRRRHKSRLKQLGCGQCYRHLARVVIHLLPSMSCPSLLWQPYWLLGYVPCRLGTLVEIIPSFPGSQPLCSWSVPGPSYPLIRVLLISFPSLTGTKPACLLGGFRSRSTSCSSSFFLLSLCAPTVFPVPAICCQSFIN